MPNIDFDGYLQPGDRGGNIADQELTLDKDLLMEQILENINNTPIGQVLKKIASLPEVRQEKVLDVRRRLTQGKYDLSGRLDIVLDRVLADLAK
ncbi:MAG: flagellar biosynthesis anti-sigma factor FlgM [Planctomycetota bacterium]